MLTGKLLTLTSVVRHDHVGCCVEALQVYARLPGRGFVPLESYSPNGEVAGRCDCGGKG